MLLLCLVLSLCGCGSRAQTGMEAQTVAVDADGSLGVDAVEAATIRLQGGESNVLGSVKQIFILDSDLYIHHGQLMSRYDRRGRFLGNISNRGRGPGEYLTLWYAWTEGRSLVLYDLNGKKTLTYDPRSGSISEKQIDGQGGRFQAAIPCAGGYVGKLSWRGMPGGELGLFDEAYNFVRPIGELELTSGLWLGNPFGRYGEEILYWRQLGDKIYAIGDDIREKYLVDFGDRSVPERGFVDDYERIEFINATPDAYAGMIDNVRETDEELMFTFIYRAKKHLAVYDKKSRRTRVCHFILPAGEVLNSIIPLDDDVLVVADVPDGNSVIYKFRGLPGD